MPNHQYKKIVFPYILLSMDCKTQESRESLYREEGRFGHSIFIVGYYLCSEVIMVPVEECATEIKSAIQ